MSGPGSRVPPQDDDARLREMNEALLVSLARQHELSEHAERTQQKLRQSEENLERELAATLRLQEISTQMIQDGEPSVFYGQILDAAVAITGSDMASIQMVDERLDALRLLAFRGFDSEFGTIFGLTSSDAKTSCNIARQLGHRAIVPDVETCDFVGGTPALDDLLKFGIRAVQSTPLCSRSGDVLGVISTHWRRPHEPSQRDLRLMDVLARQAADLMDRWRAEGSRTESERRFRTVIEQVSDYAIFTTDVEGRATSWNEGVKLVLGFDEADFLGQDVASAIFTPEDLRNGVPEQDRADAIATGRASRDRWMRKEDGTLFYAMSTTTSQWNEAHELIGFMQITRDVTDRKRLADELAESNRRKDEFLAVLSHELRNPLAPIRSGLELMRLLRDNPSKLEEIRESMERQTQQLITIVDDLLDVSRITSGKFKLRKRRIRLDDVIRSAIDASRTFIEQARHELIVDIREESMEVEADPNRLAQILSNLLNNAAKYTPAGGRIWLTAESQSGYVALTVRDTGIGISADLQKRIFDMFAQGRQPEMDHAGLGIGLTLVKSLVEMHGGTVEVHSGGPNQGSEFCVRLPILAKGEVGQEVRACEASAMIRHRVLVVDDNKAAADMLSMILGLLGHDVRTAYDGQAGIEAAADFRPEIIFLDIGMPKIDGYEAARRIRQQPGGQAMTLVALTGWGQDKDKQRAKDAGFHHHLVKPAAGPELQTLFEGLDRKSVDAGLSQGD